MGALLVLAIFFVPNFGRYLAWGIGILIFCVILFVAVKLLGKHNSRTSPVFSAAPNVFFTETVFQAETNLSLVEKLRMIDWFQFEKLIATVYQSKNYTVVRIGGANPDGGVDLMVESPATRFVVQCKQWKSWKIGVRQIREFLGTLTDSGVSRVSL